MAAPLWSVAVEVPKAAGAVFADAFASLAIATSRFETGDGANWRVEALLEREPDRRALERALALAAATAGLAPPIATVARLPDRDWLAENRRQFPPVTAGRFFVHGSFLEGRPPAGRIAIALDAGLAFGSGTHESTRGCLLALDRLARRRRFARPLDLGCGSGILALAMAKLWRARVLALDVDPVAVAVTRANARRNKVATLVRARASDGLGHPRGGGHYDLIVANILARPLQHLARSLAEALTPDGVLVLSGILAGEAASLLAAYRAQGLALAGRVRLGAWTTLIVKKAG